MDHHGDRIVMLLGEIAKCLNNTEYDALKHFAYDYLHIAVVEECEKGTNAKFELLLKMFNCIHNPNTIITWLKHVFYHLEHNVILKLILEYELEEKKMINPFTIMLNNVARQMTTQDFEDLKRYYSALVSKSDLDQVHNAFELFMLLKQRGELGEGNLNIFKKKLERLTNKSMFHIVEQFEKCKETGRACTKRKVAELIAFRPPNVQQVEHRNQREVINQGFQAIQRSSQVRFQHPSQSSMSTLHHQCTEPPSTSMHDYTQQQLGLSSGLGINAVNPRTLDNQTERKSESEAASKEGEHVYYTRTVDFVHPVSAAPTGQQDQDQTVPKARKNEDPASTVTPKIHWLEDAPNCEGEQIESASMEPKEIEESTQVKFIDDSGDSITYFKTSFTGDLLQQAEGHINKQCQVLLGRIGTDQVSVTGDMQMPAVSVQNYSDENKQVMPDKGHEHKTVPMKNHLSQLHTDSPSMISSSDFCGQELSACNREFTSGVPPTGVQKESINNHRLTENRQENLVGINSILNKPCPPIKLYSYQEELAAQALDGNNCIIWAPRGSGKSLTAAYICYVRRQVALGEERPFKALYIVCRRNLVKQRREELLKMFTAEEMRSEIVSAMSETATLSDKLQRHDVIVLTAQVLVNAFNTKDINLENIQLLILDECQYTNFNHPYNVIMQEYHRLKLENHLVPQVVGLTALLGVGKKGDPVEHYIGMCANLDCSSITYVRKNRAELLEHNPCPEKSQIISVLPRDPNDLFVLIVTYLMTETEQLAPLLSTAVSTDIPPRGSQKYENWVVSSRKEAERIGLVEGVFSCQTLSVYNTSLIYCDELATIDVLHFIKQHFRKVDGASESSEIITKIITLYKSQQKELEEVAAGETLDDNEKLKKLHDLLTDLYCTNPNAKGILLTRTRFGVEGLLSFIKRQNGIHDVVKCERFVGQGRGEDLMSEERQQVILSRFKLDSTEKDHINLLVATDIAQEGWDLPQCNFVIRYNFVPSEIGLIQSRSLATAKNSECYLIVNKGSVNEIREYENLANEQAMMEALEEIHQIKEEDLLERIDEQKAKMWKKKEAEEGRKSLLESLCDIKDIAIYCKKCNQMLCYGRDLKKRGPQFIAYSAELENKIKALKNQKPVEFRFESHIGQVYCKGKSCKQKLGLHIKYKYGTSYGYALNSNSVVWGKIGSNNYRTIKQWSKVPFAIKEEPVAP